MPKQQTHRQRRGWLARLPAAARAHALEPLIYLLVLLDTALRLNFDVVIVVVLAAGVAAIPIRRRYPRLALLLSLPAASTRTTVFPALFALYELGRGRGGFRRLLPWMVPAWLIFMVPLPPQALLQASPPQQLQAALYSILLVLAPTALGVSFSVRSELRASIAERAAAAERARIAREMHDVVAHDVSLIAVQAGGLQVSSPDEKTREIAGTLRELSVRTLSELRALVGVLRASGDQGGQEAVELAPQPTLQDLDALITESGLPVNTDIDDELDQIPSPVQRAAYRVVQEALTNIRKHAPHAETSVRLADHDDRIEVEVVNQRRTGPLATMSLPSGGHGLTGLRERASALGGELRCGATADGGFQVWAELPYDSSKAGTG